MELTSYELYQWLKENKEKIKEGKIEKIWQINDNIIFRIYNQGEKFQLIVAKDKVFITNKEIKKPLYPPSFVMRLRKYLLRKKILDVYMQELDRVLVLEFEDVLFISELFGNRGNILLVDKESKKILAVMEPKEWKDRILKTHKVYEEIEHPLNILKTSKEKFIQMVENQKDEIITREIIRRFGIPREVVIKAENECSIEEKEKIKDISKEKLLCLYEKIKEMYEFQVPSINEVLENRYFKELLVIEEEEVKQKEERKSKVERDIKNIEKAIEELKKKITEEENLAEFMSIHAHEIERVRKEALEGKSREDVEINYESKNLRLLIEGRVIKINYELNVYQNINLVYERIKRFKQRLKDLEEKLEKLKQKAEAISVEQPERKGKVKKKVAWYEKFRWFFTSNNLLCVAAKDASTNEVLIKKYMHHNDLVFHSLEPGSPFALLKEGREKAKEQDILECAQFTLCFSKLWKAEISYGEVFYVYPEQVSKEAPSGEYIGKGMFMIRGKRHIYKLPLEMAVIIDDEGLKIGPLIKYINYKPRVVITPGPIPAKELVKKIKERFENQLGKKLKEIDDENIVARIPYGKGYVR